MPCRGCILLLLFAWCAWAQTPADTFAVEISYVNNDPVPLESELKQCCLERLQQLGYITGQRGQHQMWIRSAAVPGRNEQIAISYTCYSALPRPVLQFNKEHEVFYKAMDAKQEKEYPAEGKMVREYVSDEFMRCYLVPLRMDLLFTNRTDLKKACEKMVDDLLGQTVNLGKQNKNCN